jgi:tryptophanyl-tRNA synthetase
MEELNEIKVNNHINENLSSDSLTEESLTFEATKAKSKEIETDLKVNPQKYRVLTGDRPTGNLHIGHLFGTIENRVRIQNMGIETFIVIADYQVLTDRDSCGQISENVKELVIDYISSGIDPENDKTFIFPHSHVPELNQLIIPFLFLVSMSELDRNPTVKEEIKSAQLKNISAGMYMYPVHQAADILSVGGNLVPVGKDQLPHLEISRVVARRFNNRFAKENSIFAEPQALLSNAPVIIGLDGTQKMSKSRNNAIMLKATEDETAKLIKKAKTDSERLITYDVINRPEVSNLLKLISLTTGREPEVIAAEIGDAGSGKLKNLVTESINAYLAPIRKKRAEIEKDEAYIREVLKKGVQRAREEAEKTLKEVRRVMNMEF